MGAGVERTLGRRLRRGSQPVLFRRRSRVGRERGNSGAQRDGPENTVGTAPKERTPTRFPVYTHPVGGVATVRVPASSTRYVACQVFQIMWRKPFTVPGSGIFWARDMQRDNGLFDEFELGTGEGFSRCDPLGG